MFCGGGKKSAASAPPSGDLARATSSTATSASLVRRSAWEKGVKAAQVTGAAVGIAFPGRTAELLAASGVLIFGVIWLIWVVTKTVQLSLVVRFT